MYQNDTRSVFCILSVIKIINLKFQADLAFSSSIDFGAVGFGSLL